MVRGVGAFIEGAFGGYGWGEDLKDRRRDRERTDRLDRIAEEQRAIDNRRNELRDRILQDEHTYNQTLRDQALADEEARRAALAAAGAATDEARTRGATPRTDATEVTVGGPVETAPAAAPVTGGSGTAAPAGNPMADRLGATVTPRVNIGQSASETEVDPQTALAAADELVRRAEESRDPAAIQRAIDARNALRERLLGPSLDGRTANDDRAIIDQRVQESQPPAAAPAPQRPTLTDPGPLSPAGGPRTVAGPPAAAPPAGPEQFIPSPSMIPAPVPAPRGALPAIAPIDRREMEAAAQPDPADVRAALAARQQAQDAITARGAMPTGPEPFIPADNGRPGMTREPVVNPMRVVGQPTSSIPIGSIMPPAARQQMQEAAPAVADRLEETRLPSTTLAADTIRAGGARPEGPAAGMPAAATRGATRPQARPTEGGASLADPRGTDVTKDRPSTRETPRSWASTFAEVGVPIMEEQLIRAGRPDLAAEWTTWAASQTAQDGYEAYGRAVLASARGDIAGFSDAIQTIYDSEYMPDGWETDRKASQFWRDEEGNIVGAQVVLRNTETGEMRVENYETIDELVSDLLAAVSPEAAFAAHLQRQQDERTRAQERIIEREANNAETAQAIRDQLKVLEETRGNPTMPDPVWQAMTPEQRVAEAAAIVRATQAAAERAAPSPGAGPTVTQGAALPDWTEE